MKAFVGVSHPGVLPSREDFADTKSYLVFIIEGIITVACVFLVLFCLPDYPARAKFLSEDDKKFVQDRIAVKGGGYTQEKSTRKEVLATALSPRMMAHYLAYVSLSASNQYTT